jgi:hypothetical protein
MHAAAPRPLETPSHPPPTNPTHLALQRIYLRRQLRRVQLHPAGPRRPPTTHKHTIQVAHDVGALIADGAAGGGVDYQGGGAATSKAVAQGVVHLPGREGGRGCVWQGGGLVMKMLLMV